MTTETAKPPLTNAPASAGPEAPPPRPSYYRAEFLVETPAGYHVLIAGEELRPADLMAWLKLTDAGLKGAGMKPVDRRQIVNVEVAAAAPSEPAQRGGRQGGGAKYTGEVYTECPDCGGDVYNNLQKKAKEPKWRGPFFKCRADCGFVVFKADGTPNSE